MKTKIQIINCTDLDYRNIGLIIDKIQEMKKGDTIYAGLMEYTKLEFRKKVYLIQIRYMKNYVSFDFAEIGEGK